MSDPNENEDLPDPANSDAGRGHPVPPCSVVKNLRAEAERLKNDRCEAFPNLICNEVTGLSFDAWCDPCKARHIVNFFSQNAEVTHPESKSYDYANREPRSKPSDPAQESGQGLDETPC